MPNRTASRAQSASLSLFRFARDGLRQSGLFAGLTVVVAAQLLTIGCGSDDDSEPFADYEGTWRVEFGTAATPASVFTLNCTTSAIMTDLPLWDRLVLQRGTLSDIVETAGPSNCQFPFQVDASKSIASVPAADPFTGSPVTCSVLVNSSTDATTGDAIDLVLEVRPSPWTFKLSPPTKGKAPTAQLTGSSAGVLAAFNQTTMMGAGTDTTCKYDLLVNLTKIAQE